MNKRSVTPAQARYRMRFKTYAVPDPAPKSAFMFNRTLFGKAIAFVAVFSLVFSTVTPSAVIAADEVTETIVAPDSEPTDTTESTDTESTDKTTEEAEAVNTPAPMVTICHRQDNADPMPYEQLSLNANGAVNGHSNHGGPIWYEGIDGEWGDIIPPIPSEQYPGMNWTTEGEEIWNNDCMVGGDPDPDQVPINIEIKKEWQDSNGTEISAPDNKNDITIEVTFNESENAICQYVGDLIDCDKTIWGLSGVAVNVTETGVPSGFEVDPSTVGLVVPECPDLETDDSADERGYTCTVTVINKIKDAAPCGIQLVGNGSFELPVVNTNEQWDVFPSGTPNLQWSAKWVRTGGDDRPDIANVELHRGVAGWDSQDGNQHTELDSDYTGPGPDDTGGEDASIQLFQDIPTKIGHEYVVTFWTSPRPGQGTGNNVTKVEMGGEELATITEDGASNSDTVWTEHTYTFIATSTFSRLSFTDMGSGNSLGAFLDNVSVEKECASDVTICKYDDNQNPLPGWEVYLKGDVVDTVTVYPDGNDYLSDNLPAGDYELAAHGTYVYRPDEPTANISDAAFSKRLESEPYVGPYSPWFRVNDFPVPYTGLLGIKVNGAMYDWGNEFNPAHNYTGAYNLAANGTIPFRIEDDYYDDNSGSLSVDLSPIFKGTTGSDGCVTLTNIPLGGYELGEVMQDGWENVSGNGDEVEVDQAEEIFTLVNECTSENCDRPAPQLHLIKVVCDQYSDVAGNQDADENDDTPDSNYVDFKNYFEGEFNQDFLVDGFVHPSEIPQDSNCTQADDWQFLLSTDQDQENNTQTVTTTVGEYVTPISGEGSDLLAELQQGIRGQNDYAFWVSEVQQKGYDFATLRCNDDVLYGDNLEFIDIGDSNPTDIYCIAYNITTDQGEKQYFATGQKWNDYNGNGNQDEGDNGIENWPIYLTKTVDSLSVASDSETGSNSVVLDSGKTYIVKVSGTFEAGDDITADAQYSERNSNPNWTDLVQSYESYGPTLLDLQIDGSSPYWGAYNNNHVYYTYLGGNNTDVNFKINDIAHAGNVGSLDVEIYELLDTTYTDSDGNYSFEVTNLDGPVTIIEGQQVGWQQTAPNDPVYDVPTNENTDGNDFGNHQVCISQRQQQSLIGDAFSFISNIIIGQDLPQCGNGISGRKTLFDSEGTGLEGWVIYLDLNNNSALDDGEPYDSTDSDGYYFIGYVPTGTYHVREANQPGWTQTAPGGDGSHTVEVLDTVIGGINFENREDETGGGDLSIRGKVYHDNNTQNGTLDPEEDGLAGWIVYIDGNDNDALDGDEQSTETDSNGDYTLSGLTDGCYTIREILQDGWENTEPVAHEYVVSLGTGCPDTLTVSAPSSVRGDSSHWYNGIIKTANADEPMYNFGNVQNEGGGGNNGGGGGGNRNNNDGGGDDDGQVLGDFTGLPYVAPLPGEVLGATTLPVTGSPAWIALFLALMAAPMLYFRTLAVADGPAPIKRRPRKSKK